MSVSYDIQDSFDPTAGWEIDDDEDEIEPVTNDTYGHGRRYTLVGDIGKWLRVNGHSGKFIYWPENLSFRVGPIYELSFDRPDLAVLFKLTWM